MDVLAVGVSTNDKGVLPFEKPAGKFITDPVRFFGGQFSRLERLPYLISDDILSFGIVVFISSGNGKVLPSG